MLVITIPIFDIIAVGITILIRILAIYSSIVVSVEMKIIFPHYINVIQNALVSLSIEGKELLSIEFHLACGPLPDPGECLGHVNMWYFDRQANRCKQFEYSGCKGNENKFVKEEECIDTCIHRMINL